MFNQSEARPHIIDDPSFIDNGWHFKARRKLFQFKACNGKLVHFVYKPSEIYLEKDKTFSWKGNKPNPEKVDEKIFIQYCKAVKAWQIREKGWLTTNDSAFIALYILEKYPKIAKSLAKRFPVIIVDEAQDTSEIQFAILDQLMLNGLISLELVGDPYQCLYEWRNAMPDLFLQRARDKQAWQVIPLNDNRRSTPKIIKCYSLLRHNSEPEIRGVSEFDREPSIKILKYIPDKEIEAVKKYEQYCQDFEENHIVVRGQSLRRKLLGIADANTNFWHSPIPYKLIEAKKDFDLKLVKSAVKKIRSLIPVILNPEIDYSQRRLGSVDI